ncbi:MAG: M14 family metallopeptidase [Myxococcaceae bacterium]|nr:M14 family metallopeptidase [Myxococcaceae bacterium]
MTLGLTVWLLAAVPAPLTTQGERSGYVETGRYDEVLSLCDAFPQRYPGRVKCEKFGTTPEGRPMVALIASDDGALGDAAVRSKKRPVVYLQGGIHAGEIDGKDAGFWLLRDLLDRKVGPGWLKAITVVFVPVLNVDGHERFGPHNRPNQVGPKEMGFRTTSQNFNLNRDWLKADAPETQAVLGLLNRYEPVLFLDLHVTDGAKFQHDISIMLEPQRVGPSTLMGLGRATSTEVLSEMTAKGHLPLDFYPSFDDYNDPASGFSRHMAPPRFANAYWAYRNRFGVLVETHSWKDYRARVIATYDACVALLGQAVKVGAAWRSMIALNDAQQADLRGADVVLVWRTDEKQSHPIEFQGYAYTREESTVSGQKWTRYDESKPQVWNVPMHDVLQPAVTVAAPREGYYVPAPYAALVSSKLKVHGIRFEVLKKAQAIEAERFKATQLERRPESFEGHATVKVQGEWAQGPLQLPPGSLFVPIAQAQSLLLMHLLEPAAPDSLVSWGFFNAHFESKEYMEDYIAEEVAREMLKDPAVKAQFDERLKKDAAFAKSPEKRLGFFYERHPSFDERLNLYPIGRR